MGEPEGAAKEDTERPAPLRGPDLIKTFAEKLPQAPGVYRMLNAKGEVLYVGKARSLKNRVTAYTKIGAQSYRIQRMIAETADMEFVRTQSEIEALLLEANLIKRLKPRYNITLRDDKSFAEILLRRDHAFPQVLKHRGARAVKGAYFGPFASAYSVNRTLNTLQRAFLLRSCSDSVFEGRTRPCLLHQIKRCSAPCTSLISEEDYAGLVQQAEDFLSGKDESVKAQFQARMEKAAADLDFESAANYRDRIRALAHIQLNQDINPANVKEADVVALAMEGGQACVQVFFFRAGQNWGNRAYFPRHDRSEGAEEVLDAFLAQFYDNKEPPRLVLLSHDVPGRELLAEALSVRSERRIEVSVPQRGERRALIEHAMTNARDALGRRLAESASQAALIAAVGDLFGLESPPQRIEVYDNSHIQGTDAVGAMIVAGPDGFEKGQYRKFNIKSSDLTPGDDYAMMREVLTRRLQRLKKALETDDPALRTARPDLLLIDGGQGQLAVACAVAAEHGLHDLAIIAIAKGEDRNAGRERFFRPGAQPRSLEPNSPVLYYLQRLRDEAHRFAIGTHRAKRAKGLTASSLDEVPGIGSRRKRALLQHFGSARAVERAGLQDLEAVEGISHAIAKRIHDYFRSEP